MSIEAKLDILITATQQIAEAQAANQTAMLSAIGDITEGDTSNITAAIKDIDTQLTGITATLGTEVAPTPPIPPTPPVTAASAPVITAVSPNNGSVEGSTAIVVTGSGFTGVTAVNVGTNPATSFTFGDDTSLKVVTPTASKAGIADITIITPAGTSTIVPADQFTYA